MNTILGWLSQNALTVAVLIPVVWLLCWRLRLQPASQYLLWLLLLAKLLLPLLVEWPLPALPVARMGFAIQAEEEETQSMGSVAVADLGSVDQGIGAIATYPTLDESATGTVIADQGGATAEIGGVGSIARDVGLEDISGGALVGAVEENREADASRSPEEIAVMVIAGAWLVGSGAALAWFVARLWATRRLLRRSLAAPAKLTALVTQVAKRAGVRRVIVRITSEIDAPCVVSLGRPVLLWPEKLTHSATTTHRAVLVHELAHIARRDHWVLWLEALGGLVWWWNPCFWHIRRQLHDARELACDALALMHGGGERSQYAKLLLELTTGQSFTFRPMPVCGVGAGSKRSLERRLQMLFDERTSGRPGWLGWLAAAAVAALIVPAWSVGQDTGGAAEKPATENKVEAGTTAAGEEKGVSGTVQVPDGGTVDLKSSSAAQPQFQRGGDQVENSLVRKWADDKEPAKTSVEGVVTAVDGGFVELSIGSKDGIHVREGLPLIILKTGERWGAAKATAVIVKVRSDAALARIEMRHSDEPIAVKDSIYTVGEIFNGSPPRFLARRQLSKGVNLDTGLSGIMINEAGGVAVLPNDVGPRPPAANTTSTRQFLLVQALGGSRVQVTAGEEEESPDGRRESVYTVNEKDGLANFDGRLTTSATEIEPDRIRVQVNLAPKEGVGRTTTVEMRPSQVLKMYFDKSGAVGTPGIIARASNTINKEAGIANGVGVNSDAGVTGTIAGDGSGGTIGIDLGAGGARNSIGIGGTGNSIAGESTGTGENKTTGSLSRSTTGNVSSSGARNRETEIIAIRRLQFATAAATIRNLLGLKGDELPDGSLRIFFDSDRNRLVATGTTNAIDNLRRVVAKIDGTTIPDTNGSSSRSTGFSAGPGKRVIPLVGPATVDVETPDGTFSIWMPETDNGSSSRPWLLRLEKDGKVHNYNLSEITSKPTPDKPKGAQGAAIEKGLNDPRQSQPSAATPAASAKILKLDVELAEVNLEQKKLALEQAQAVEKRAPGMVSSSELKQLEFEVRRAEIELRRCKAILEANKSSESTPARRPVAAQSISMELKAAELRKQVAEKELQDSREPKIWTVLSPAERELLELNVRVADAEVHRLTEIQKRVSETARQR